MSLDIDLTKVNYTFLRKPLLIGGKAMEYYELRKAGKDIDFVISTEDYEELKEKYPDPECHRDLFGDLGTMVEEFEIWKCICLFDYEFLSENAIEKEGYLIISLEKLLFLKALAMKEEKYHKDLELIVKKIFKIQYDTKLDEKYKKDLKM